MRARWHTWRLRVSASPLSPGRRSCWVRAAAELARRNAKFKLLIVGMAEASEIAERFRKRMPPALFPISEVPHEDVQRYFPYGTRWFVLGVVSESPS